MTYKLLLTFIMITAPHYALALYKCSGAEGKTVYQASPCQSNPDAQPHKLDMPPPELQEKMRLQQLQRNAEIARQDREEAKRQGEADRLNFWRNLEAQRVANENAHQERVRQQIEEESYRRQMDITCFSRLPGSGSEECEQWRYDKRWNN